MSDKPISDYTDALEARIAELAAEVARLAAENERLRVAIEEAIPLCQSDGNPWKAWNTLRAALAPPPAAGGADE